MADPVHEALIAFMEASDFLAGKEVVERLHDVLLSDEAIHR